MEIGLAFVHKCILWWTIQNYNIRMYHGAWKVGKHLGGASSHGGGSQDSVEVLQYESIWSWRLEVTPTANSLDWNGWDKIPRKGLALYIYYCSIPGMTFDDLLVIYKF